MFVKLFDVSLQTTQNLNEVTKDLGIAKIDFKEANRINEELLEAKKMVYIVPFLKSIPYRSQY